MRQDKTTGTVKPVPVFYAVLCVGRILSLSRTSFYDPVCCFVFFFAVVTEAISFLLITLQFSEIHIARDSKRKMECVAAYSSLYPLMIYYLNRLNDWGLYFRKCKICGKVFLAKSQRYELCSDKCRKKQSLQNKREFDERARENNYDLLYKNECQNWRNKINKAKKTSGFPADRLEEMLAAFESFKKEALQRKQAVKKKTASPKEFSGWLLRQSNIIVELAESKN